MVIFSIWIFFHEHSWLAAQQRKGEAISLTPLYYFHSFNRQLDFSRAIIAENSRLHIASDRTGTGNLCSERKSLTTKLCALEEYFFTQFVYVADNVLLVNQIMRSNGTKLEGDLFYVIFYQWSFITYNSIFEVSPIRDFIKNFSRNSRLLE